MSHQKTEMSQILNENQLRHDRSINFVGASTSDELLTGQELLALHWDINSH